MDKDESGTQPDLARLRQPVIQLKVDQTTPYYHHFRVDGNRIEFVEPFTTLYSQVLLEETLPRVPVYSFSFRVCRSYYQNSKRGAAIFIGVTRRKYKEYRNSQFCSDVFTYFGKKSMVFPGRIKMGAGYNFEDVVMVRIDRNKSRI